MVNFSTRATKNLPIFVSKTENTVKTSFLLAILLVIGAWKISAQSYTRGHYTDLDKRQHKGQIAFKIGQNFFEFKAQGQKKEARLKPEEVQSFVWGVDSFVVRQEAFARVIVPEGRVRLYRKDQAGERQGWKRVVGENLPGYSYLERTFIVERPASGEILVLENKKKKKFIAQVQEFFSDAPGLTERVEKGEFGPGDIRRLVQVYNEEYAEKESQND